MRMGLSEVIITISVAVLASPVITKVLDYLLPKIFKKNQLYRIENKINKIEDDLADVKLDELRTNILLLLHDYPDSADIPTEAEKYVVKYGGNSYIIPLICSWYSDKGLTYPEWLQKANKEHVKDYQ